MFTVAIANPTNGAVIDPEANTVTITIGMFACVCAVLKDFIMMDSHCFKVQLAIMQQKITVTVLNPGNSNKMNQEHSIKQPAICTSH